MFTGLIEEIGTVESVRPLASGREIRIRASRVLADLSPEDSISVNGACLTVTRTETNFFESTAVLETLQRSTLGRLVPGQRVNLERALKVGDRLGGHFVQGHVDGVGKIISLVPQGMGRLFEVEIPAPLSRYTIEKGSIAIDGISLTIARLKGNRLTVSVIPYTLEHTTLGLTRPGTEVNVEVDVLGKYVERFFGKASAEEKKGEEWFRSLGY